MLAVDNCYFPFHLTKSLIFNYLSVPPQTLSEAFDAFFSRPGKSKLPWELRSTLLLIFTDSLLITSERERSTPRAARRPLCLWLRCIIEYQLVSERLNKRFKLSSATKSTLFSLCPSLYAFDIGVDTFLWVRSCRFPGAWLIAENYHKKLKFQTARKKA